MDLLSHTISVQSLQESIPKILSLERKEGGREKEERGARLQEGAAVSCARGKKERERVRG